MLGHRHSCCFRKPVLSTPRANPRPQVKLKQTTPQTEEEKTEHSVAAERRRMRLLYADTIKDLLANCVIQDGERPWVGRAAGMLHAPSVPGPQWAEGGRESPWNVHSLS